MDVATLLRNERGRAALTQCELARKAGVSQSTVSAVERGTRRPSLAMIGRILAGLGLRLRPVIEPAQESEAELDAAMDVVSATPAAERLVGPAFDGPELLRMLAPLEPVVEGATGAALHGAPVAVSTVDVAVERSRIDALATIVRTTYAERWSEVYRNWMWETLSRRERGPLRYRVLNGEFRVRLVDERPDAVTILVGELPVAVRALHDIEVDDPKVKRALARLRERAD